MLLFHYPTTQPPALDYLKRSVKLEFGSLTEQRPTASHAVRPWIADVLLADEVGLGKTIEAGLVLAQRWAERRRRILVITPSNLRKQWHQELTEKFFLPCRILEAKSYNDAIKAGQFRPFEADGHIVICSYQFARNKAADVNHTAWDLVVMDEAHRLRNVYKPAEPESGAVPTPFGRARSPPGSSDCFRSVQDELHVHNIVNMPESVNIAPDTVTHTLSRRIPWTPIARPSLSEMRPPSRPENRDATVT